MGNYNCQECVDKEVNIINELLLDNKLFGSDPKDKENLSQLSRRSNLRASREDLKKAIENTNLSQEQKNFVHKMLKDNELLENEGIESLKLRIGKNNLSNENEISHEQKKIIEDQKEKILEQEKIIKRQAILLEEQKKLKEEEALLKKEIEKAQGKQREKEEENINIQNKKDIQDAQQGMDGVKIKTLEPPKKEDSYKGEKEQKKDKVQVQQVQQDDNPKNQDEDEVHNEEENEDKNESENKNDNENENEDDNDNMQEFRKNIRPIRREREEDYYEEDEQYQEQEQEQEEDTLNDILRKQNNSGNKLFVEQKKEQMIDENQNIIGTFEQQNMNLPQSQKFKIETYEPIEQGPKNSYGNDDDFNEINDEKDQNYNEINDNYGINNNNYQCPYIKREERKNEPKDSRKPDFKNQRINHVEEEEIYNNNINYNDNDIEREKGPKDTERNYNTSNNKEIKFKGSFNDEITNSNKAELFDSMKIFEAGPRDSKRKDPQQNYNINNDNQYNFTKNALEIEKQNLLKQRQLFLERNEINDEELINNNNNVFNIEANPISTAISNAVLNQNNIMQKNENGQNFHHEYRFVKKEIINPSEQEYNIFQQQQNYSPKFNDINNTGALNNVISGNINDRNDGVINSLQREFDLNQQLSQKEFDVTTSERDNPLIYSDDKGNMNYLERQYEAYQSRMNQNNDNYNY